MTVEPYAPEKGPDLRADSDGAAYFVEVRAVGFSEEEERVDLVTKEIFRRLGPVPSSYYLDFTCSPRACDETALARSANRDLACCS
jgi:hypothetical protein